MENVSISEQLRYLREKSGLSIRSLAERLRMPSSTYANYESRFKRQYLPMEFVRDLVVALSGTGISEAEILSLAGIDEPQRIENGDKPPVQARMVPVYDLAASAGHGALVDYEAVAYSLAFPPAYLDKLTRSHPRNLAIISVKGESMLPTLKDDDIVMVDTSKKNIGYDGMFVLRHMDVIKVKRLRLSPDRSKITLSSDNQALYPPEEWPSDEIEVIGRVIWVGGKV